MMMPTQGERISVLEAVIPQMAADTKEIKGKLDIIIEQHVAERAVRAIKVAYSNWVAGVLSAIVVLTLDKLIPWVIRKLGG
jgi:hypothetical protein